ncbi:MAG: thrombospondin type 3 repeat-containing protein, partial [Verrucomicrobiota bacterium]
NHPQWTAIENMSSFSYETLQARLFSHEDILVLSRSTFIDFNEDGSNDVDGVSSLTGIAMAITNWASGADQLNLFLIGPETNGILDLGSGESLAAPLLDDWLDKFQVDDRRVQLVMEFARSGSFLSELTAPPSRERISIASAQADQEVLWSGDGLISFLSFFLNHIIGGETIGDAFNLARRAIRSASGPVRQTALLDDDGDGVADPQFGTWSFASASYIGPAFVTGDNPPFIGDVISDFISFTNSVVTLWADELLDVDGISNVWCFITPPDFDGHTELERTKLTMNPITARYEVSYVGFDLPGRWNLTFLAEDREGCISPPAQSSVTVTTLVQIAGRVRDEVTGAWVDGASIQFDNGVTNDWVSMIDGRFPPSVRLSVGSWKLTLARTDFLPRVFPDIEVGSDTNLGMLFMTPVDTNFNGIADVWEQIFFGGPVDAAEDSDQDGLSNFEEYLAGTDPTDIHSVFKIRLAITNGVELSWTTYPGREYVIETAGDLLLGDWTSTGFVITGTTEAVETLWTDPDPPATGRRYYRSIRKQIQ